LTGRARECYSRARRYGFGEGSSPVTKNSARPAATVILARPASSGFEVLLLRRLASAASFADAFVFPGGVVRDDDGEPDPTTTSFRDVDALAALTERGGEPPDNARLARALFRGAIREVFEEAGVLLARDANGAPVRLKGPNEAQWADYREAMQADRMTLGDLLAREAIVPDYRGLTYFSHWITPDDIARRYDTRFFVAELPLGQTAVHCRVETTESVWIAPRDAIQRAGSSLPLVLPTRVHLTRLSHYLTLDDLLAFARMKRIRTVHPARFSEAQVNLAAMLEADAPW
jgi:8-oxo-dGTP pyrophosphatase MutT (NUDIX family)